MQKWDTTPQIFRLPSSKKYPKGLRVRKAIESWPEYMGTAVVAVRDGRHFFTKQILTPE